MGVTTASRYRFFNDAQWEMISRLLPSNDGRRGHPFGDDRRVVEGTETKKRNHIRPLEALGYTVTLSPAA